MSIPGPFTTDKFRAGDVVKCTQSFFEENYKIEDVV